MPSSHGGRRPGAGRKPTGDAKRTVRIVVAFTADEADELEDSRHGKPLATHVHDLAMASVRRISSEASEVGDHEQMIICGIADDRYADDPSEREHELAGHAYHLLLSPEDYRRFGRMTVSEARGLCADAINNARAQED